MGTPSFITPINLFFYSNYCYLFFPPGKAYVQERLRENRLHTGYKLLLGMFQLDTGGKIFDNENNQPLE